MDRPILRPGTHRPAGGLWTIGTGRPTAAVHADTIAYMRALAGRDNAVALSLVSGDEPILPLISQARIPFRPPQGSPTRAATVQQRG